MRKIILAVLVAAFIMMTTSNAFAADPRAHATRKAPVAQKTERVYAAFGDSITYGVGANNPATENYATQAGIESIGQSGSCVVNTCYLWTPLYTRFMQEVLRDMPVRPDVVVVAMGVNDLNTGITPTQLKKGYRALVAQAAVEDISVVFATITPPGYSNPVREYDRKLRAGFNSWIRSTYPNNCVDFSKALRNRSGYMKACYDSGDGLHPSTAGQTKLAETLKAYMKSHP